MFWDISSVWPLFFEQSVVGEFRLLEAADDLSKLLIIQVYDFARLHALLDPYREKLTAVQFIFALDVQVMNDEAVGVVLQAALGERADAGARGNRSLGRVRIRRIGRSLLTGLARGA